MQQRILGHFLCMYVTNDEIDKADCICASDCECFREQNAQNNVTVSKLSMFENVWLFIYEMVFSLYGSYQSQYVMPDF